MKTLFRKVGDKDVYILLLLLAALLLIGLALPRNIERLERLEHEAEVLREENSILQRRIIVNEKNKEQSINDTDDAGL